MPPGALKLGKDCYFLVSFFSNFLACAIVYNRVPDAIFPNKEARIIRLRVAEGAYSYSVLPRYGYPYIIRLA